MSTHIPSSQSSSQFSNSAVVVNDGTFVHGTLNYNFTNGGAEAFNELKQHSSPDALHTSEAVSRQNMCTPGTRTDTLDRLRSLATSSDPDSPDVIWMHGPAGAGKSAIVRTLANDLSKEGFLLASFFFFRSENQRKTPRRFIPTIAARAWDALPASQAHIAKAIHSNHDLFTRPAHGQSPLLLEEPLVAAAVDVSSMQACRWTPATPATIIIDGLDECTDAGTNLEGQTEIIKAMVQLASSIRTRTDRRIKIFIASRPEHQIKATFNKLGANENGSVKEIQLTSKDAEIHLFYEEQFKKIREKFGLPPSWPPKEDVEWLKKKSSGQYAFADVSTRFVHGGDPVGRLKIIRDGVKDDKLNPFEPLNQLYVTVLNQVPEDMRRPALLILHLRLHPEWHTDCNSILEPLLQLPRGYVQTLRPYLSSLIDFDCSLGPYHASLADFLLDPSRSEKFSLCVDNHTISHAIQRGVLSIFESSSNYLSGDEEHGFYKFIHSVYPELNLLHWYSLPSGKLTQSLKRIKLTSPPIALGISLCHLLNSLQKESLQFRLFCLTHPVLWYTIRYALPRQIRVGWEQRTMLYSGFDQAQVDLLFGLGLVVTEVDILEMDKAKLRAWLGFRQVVGTGWVLQYFSKEFPIDPLQGWGFSIPRSRAHIAALRYHFQTSSNRRRFWRYMQAVLQFVSDCPSSAPIRQTMLHSIHLDHSNLTRSVEGIHRHPSLCSKCAKTISRIDTRLLEGVGQLIRDQYTPRQPQELLVICRIVQASEACWSDGELIVSLLVQTKQCLRMFRFRYMPAFLVQSQKKELEDMAAALECRRNELGELSTTERLLLFIHRPGIQEILELTLLEFFRFQLRKHQDLCLFVICGLFACLSALYIVLWRT